MRPDGPSHPRDADLSFESDVLRVLGERSGSVLSIRSIRDALGDPPPDLADRLDDLVRRGIIWTAGKRDRYALPETLNLRRGRIRFRRGGSAFLDSGSSGRIEIERRDVSDSLDGDLVMVRIRPASLGGGRGGDGSDASRLYGRVIAVLERSRETVGGVLFRTGRGDWVLHPLDASLPPELPVRKGPDPALTSGRVVIGQLVYDNGVEVVVDRVIGSSDKPTSMLDGLLGDLGIPASFPERVLSEADEVATLDPLQGSSRADHRDWFTITIDPADARDFDDAVSVGREGDGYLLGVHIADVAFYVRPGTLLDNEAFARSTSVYLPDRVVPMLPEILSAGACSLRPEVDRAARTVLLAYDSNGERIEERTSIESSMIRSNYRLTYGEVEAYLCGDESPDDPSLSSALECMSELMDALAARRRERGSLELGSEEYGVVFDEAGWPAELVRRSTDDAAHRMIELFMIEANRAVAEFCKWSELPVLYRVHPPPGPDSIRVLGEELGRLGMAMPRAAGINAASLSGILAEAGDGALASLVREAVLRSLSRASYSPECQGHFGLALRDYLHFTSPIRRYPDLLVHRALSQLEGGELPGESMDLADAGSHTSETERVAERAERRAVELMALMNLSGRTGEVVSGVVVETPGFGAFVRLDDYPVDGLVPVRFLRGRAPKIGSGLRCTIDSVDVLAGRITLRPGEFRQGGQ